MIHLFSHLLLDDLTTFFKCLLINSILVYLGKTVMKCFQTKTLSGKQILE